MGYDDISGENIPGVRKTLRGHIEKLSKIKVNEIESIVYEIIRFLNFLSNFQATGYTSIQNMRLVSGSLESPLKVIKNALAKYSDLLNSLVPDNFSYSIERVYIPMLRGLRPTQFHDDSRFDETQDNYLKRTVRDYFRGNSIKEEEIFTGLRLYNDTKRMLLGKQEERDKIKKFENFISKSFFNNQSFTLIPNIEDDSLHVSIGNEEWPIYQLGDGIQSIIILLYPLFFNQGKRMMVFIEEPENSMHPGLQRLFLETIMQSNFGTFQYFITTHSNHFLDFTSDILKISVYTFIKAQNDSGSSSLYRIENSSNQNVNILDLIGARNSSVFLSNCTIWVEGITDRLYLKRYLELYQESLNKMEGSTFYKEDFNFSFIEYGGNNITHWTFGDDNAWEKIKANNISSRIFLVADKDSTAVKLNSEKAKRLKYLKEILGERFQIIDGREIENILSPSVLIASIKALENDNAKNVDFNESKLSINIYLNKPLGKFVKSYFKNVKRRYEADSGTLFCKLDFCRAALKNLNSLNDLSKEALQLTEMIYTFIVSSNSK